MLSEIERSFIITAVLVSQELLDLHNDGPEALSDVFQAKNLKIAGPQDGPELDKDQQAAILAVLQNPVTLITGGPGSGKTKLVLSILAIFEQLGIKKDEVALLAPTGLARRRLHEATSHEASTIHSKLWGRIDRGEKVKITQSVVIVDECSMLDINLANHLFSSLTSDTRLILIGDADQLPPVEPGQPFRDLIDSKCFPVARLSGNHRQGAGSDIASASRRILGGKLPSPLTTDGFRFLETKDDATTRDLVMREFRKHVEKLGPNAEEIGIQLGQIPQIVGNRGGCVDGLSGCIQNLKCDLDPVVSHVNQVSG